VREIKFKLRKFDKLIIIQTFLISITLLILVASKYSHIEDYSSILIAGSVLLILCMAFMIFSSINVKIYYNSNFIKLISLLPKKTRQISVVDITKVIVKKHMLVVKYLIENEEQTLLVPKTLNIDIEGYNGLLKLLDVTDEYITFEKLSLHNRRFRFVPFLFIFTQIVILLMIITSPTF